MPSRPIPWFACATLLGCVDSTPLQGDDAGSLYVQKRARVHVDTDSELRLVPPYAYGMHTSVYDNALHDPALPDLIAEAGVGLFRFPGGGYSDNYHWSDHSMSAWSDGDRGYLAPRSDFGSYIDVVEATGVALMITVNYGSNLQGTGPGEPKEAAAWVAYANGDPGDDTEIGEDSVGNDWRTVSYWASLRASDPLNDGSEHDFLRIAHPEPLAVEYWEVGNEVFGNGYYGIGEFELDLHLPYDGTERLGHPELSGKKYGREVVRWVEAMKAVDPDIKVGAVLNTPPRDLNWGPTWNDDVLDECGEVIDFGIIHWYSAENPSGLLASVDEEIPIMTSELFAYFEEYGGSDYERIELTLTEVGPGLNYPVGAGQAAGLFAADTYLSAISHGIVNIDWLELHNGSFLSERSDAKGHAFQGIRLAHLTAPPGATLLGIESNLSLVDGHAARSDEFLSVLLFNRSERQEASVVVEFGGALEFAAQGDLYRYSAGPDGESGDVDGPEQARIEHDRLELELGPYDAVVARFLVND